MEFYIKNSWGEEPWANANDCEETPVYGGNGRISARYINNYCTDFWVGL
jgi:hypothetical protein